MKDVIAEEPECPNRDNHQSLGKVFPPRSPVGLHGYLSHGLCASRCMARACTASADFMMIGPRTRRTPSPGSQAAFAGPQPVFLQVPELGDAMIRIIYIMENGSNISNCNSEFALSAPGDVVTGRRTVGGLAVLARWGV
jgi:hypothetical protein